MSKILSFLKFKLYLIASFSFLVFFALSIISYDPYDSSFNTISKDDISNLFGRFGALVSSIFLENIGFGSLWIIVFTAIVILFYAFNHNVSFFILRIISTFLASGTLAIIIDIVFVSYRYKFKFMIGGYFGYYINTLISASDYRFYFISFCIFIFFISAIFSCCLDFLIKKKESEEVDKFIDTDYKQSMYENYLKSVDLKNGKKIKKDRIILNYFKKLFRFAFFIFRFILKIFIFVLKIFLSIFRFKMQKKKNIKSRKQNNEYIEEKIKDKIFISLPKVEFLSDIKEYNPNHDVDSRDKKILFEKQIKLQKVLYEFGVKGKMISYHAGPVVTLYKFEPKSGTKSSRAIGLASDIARTMEIVSTRISNIPKQNAIGIEIPNEKIHKVGLRSIISCDDFLSEKHKIPIALGKDISGENVVVDLAKMPHLLIAGTTGSGKSVGINAMIMSILYKFSYEDCKLILIDPKMLEFTMYNDIPHLLFPVITESKRAVITLKWLVAEMERRYKVMAAIGVKNISGYNEKIESISKSKKKVVKKVKVYNEQTNEIEEKNIEIQLEKLPFIVIVIDEMADLMLVAGKDIESSVQRLSQMARASGIHIIIATQRPSVDVITGVIKSNFPIRISYQLSSKIDSRTILGEQGAEQLLGHGDMLYMEPGSKIRRVHGPIVTDNEIQKVVEFLKSLSKPMYVDLDPELYSDSEQTKSSSVKDSSASSDEELYDAAKEIVLSDNKTSISYIQRRLRIGYNKAANFIEMMEDEGFLSSPDSSGKRMILKKK